jgi:hypothetical protein
MLISKFGAMLSNSDLSEIPSSALANLIARYQRDKLEDVSYGLNQLVTNGNFADGTTGWLFSNAGTPAVSGGEIIFTPTAPPTLETTTQHVYQSVNFVTGYKYYCRGEIYGDTDTVLRLTTIEIGRVTTPNTYQTFSAVYTSAITTIRAFGVRSIKESGFTQMKAKNLMFIDLTSIFGAGLEPTAAEMDAILTADGTGYWDGERQVVCNPDLKYFWYDYSANSRHTYLGNLAYAAGSTLSATNGLELDGVDDYGNIADSAATRLTTGGTLAAWIYPETAGENSSGRIFDKSTDTSGTNGFLVAHGSNNKINAIINAGVTLASNESVITFTAWQHVAVTFDGTGRHIYVNGIDVTASGGAETALPPDVAGVVCVGNRASATDRTFDGYIDRAMMFDRALTPTEILAIYNGTRGKYV